jgi:hypothetical protein
MEQQQKNIKGIINIKLLLAREKNKAAHGGDESLLLSKHHQ